MAPADRVPGHRPRLAILLVNLLGDGLRDSFDRAPVAADMIRLAVVDLVIEFATAGGPVRALDGADLDVADGETLGIVGESGLGKSTLGQTIGRLLAAGAAVPGDVQLDGVSVFERSDAELVLRRTELAFVLQNPMSALDLDATHPSATGGRLDDDEHDRPAVEEQLRAPGWTTPGASSAPTRTCCPEDGSSAPPSPWRSHGAPASPSPMSRRRPSTRRSASGSSS